LNHAALLHISPPADTVLHVSPPGVVAVHASPSTSFAADTVIAIAALADISRVIKNDADAVTARDGVALAEETNTTSGEFTVIAIAAVPDASESRAAVAEAVNAVAAEALPLLRAEALDTTVIAIDGVADANIVIPALAATVIAIDGVADANIVIPALAATVMAVAAGVPAASRSAAVSQTESSREIVSASRLLDQLSSWSSVGPTISAIELGRRYRDVA
jgi:hypothetical protein